MSQGDSYVISCMVCGTSLEIEARPGLPFGTLAFETARKSDWAASSFDRKVFLCCSTCYPEAFDTSRGSVGTVKEGYRHLARGD